MVSDNINKQPSSLIHQSPVTFKEQAEQLLFLAYLLTDTDEKPDTLIRNIPRICLDFLHYTFLIICDIETHKDLREKTRAQYIVENMEDVYCVLGTGSLSVWHDAIVTNLAHTNLKSKNTRLILDAIYLYLTQEGLQSIFTPFTKKPEKNGTFILERK
jgi:hypothetical protein